MPIPPPDTASSPRPETLSVLVPAYNEARTLEALLARVFARPEVTEVVLVDDGSSDATAEVARRAAEEYGDRLVVAVFAANEGKGAAIRRAAELASGELCLIQDADLEYDPNDYPALLEPLWNGTADVSFGARGFSGHSAYSFWFVMGNRLIDLVANVLFNTYMTDISCCYKAMPTEVLRATELGSRRFALDPEIVAKTLRWGLRTYEVPVTYRARSRAEGKKIRLRDGLLHLQALVRYRFAPIPPRPEGLRRSTA